MVKFALQNIVENICFNVYQTFSEIFRKMQTKSVFKLTACGYLRRARKAVKQCSLKSLK